MNFVLVKSSRTLAGKRPIHHRQLDTLLHQFGVKKRIKNRNLRSGLPLRQTAYWSLWDYYDAARRHYRSQITHLHPDRGGCPQAAAQLNAMWTRIKFLFARLNIGIE